MNEGHVILAAGGILAAGLAASLAAGRLRVPGLVLFLGLGMALGPHAGGLIGFSDYEVARSIGVVALALILFEGGLTTGWAEIRPVVGSAGSLALVGTFATAAVTGVAAAWLLDMSLLNGLLLGSILAATDGAAIFALLRQSALRRRLARILECESGFNDPVAVLLVVGFIEWIRVPGYGIVDMAVLFAVKLGVGAAAGLATGWLVGRALRHMRLATAGLYPVATVAGAALAFGIAETLGGSGFLAVYLAGIVLATVSIPARQTVTAFHQGLAWVAQITMFVMLGLLVSLDGLVGVAVPGTALAMILAFVARPVATFISTAFGRFSVRERMLLGWAGLRGALPVVLATFPVIEGIPGSSEFFNVAFFAVILSVVIQGVTFEPFARLLGLTTPQPALPVPLSETGTIRRLGAEIVEAPVYPTDAIVGLRVRDLGLPRDALLNVIVRGESAIPPRGSTVICAHDRLHVLVRKEVAKQFPDLLHRWRHGPVRQPPGRGVPHSAAAVFTVRPWTAEDGDAADPVEIDGVAVVDKLRSRHDKPGALVSLADGRFAFTGPLLSSGSAKALQAGARRRLRFATDDTERAWWQEVVGALSL